MSRQGFFLLLLVVSVGVFWTALRNPGPQPTLQAQGDRDRETQPRPATPERSGFADRQPGLSASLPSQRRTPSAKRTAPRTQPLARDLLIAEALTAADGGRRAFALSELAELAPSPEILDACARALQDRDEEVRLEAILTLEALEDPSALPSLERSAKQDPSPAIRQASVDAIEYLSQLEKHQRQASFSF